MPNVTIIGHTCCVGLKVWRKSILVGLYKFKQSKCGFRPKVFDAKYKTKQKLVEKLTKLGLDCDNDRWASCTHFV